MCRRGPIVGGVVGGGLGDDRAVDNDDEPDARDTLGCGDAQLVRAKWCVRRRPPAGLEPGRLPVGGRRRRAPWSWARAFSTFSTSPRRPGPSQSSFQAPLKFSRPEIGDLHGLSAGNGDRVDVQSHRIGRLGPSIRGGDPSRDRDRGPSRVRATERRMASLLFLVDGNLTESVGSPCIALRHDLGVQRTPPAQPRPEA